MWKSDDESSLFDPVVNWATPTPTPQPISSQSPSSMTTNSFITPASPSRVQLPPLPPPSPFSELFPPSLLQSSGLLLSQFDDEEVNSNGNHSDPVVHQDGNSFRQQNIRNSSSSSTVSSSINEFNGVFRCLECKFSTHDRKLLTYHKRSKHAGEKTFSCHDCSAKFTRQYSLKKHILQKHSNVGGTTSSSQLLPKYCPYPNCKYSTRNPTSMQNHKRTHQQWYFCKECNARYTRRQSLLGHLTKQHGSNAALIGMGSTPNILNSNEDQSLQSPPPQSNSTDSNVVSTSSGQYFQQNTCMLASPDVSNSNMDDGPDGELELTPVTAFSHDDDVQSSAVVASTNTSGSIDAVVGSVAAAVSGNTAETSDTKFYCDKCQFTASSIRRLYGHKLSSHRPAKEKIITKTNHHICPHCPRKFASLKRMLTHVKKTHTAPIGQRRKRKSQSGGGKGGKQRGQQPKRQPQPSSMACDQCDFITSRKRIFAAHVKSHLNESLERNQEPKHEQQMRKSASIVSQKHPTPDRHLINVTSSSAASLPIPNSPSDVKPGLYDFYYTGAGAKYSGSGSSTHSNVSGGCATEMNSSNIGQFFISRNGSSTNSISSDRSASNGQLIRLDLANSSNSGLDEMASCVQGLQLANTSLMQLLKRRDDELRSLRTNVVDLLRLLLPNHQAFQNFLTLDNVDDMVTNTLTRVLTEEASRR